MRLIELAPRQCLILKAGGLFDGTGSPVQKNVTIYIKNQKISSVETAPDSLADIMKSTKKTDPYGNTTAGGKDIPGDLLREKWFEDEIPFHSLCPPPPEINRQDCPGGLRVLDLPGCTILPGMIDCHVHLALDGRDFHKSLNQWSSPEQLGERVKKELQTTLDHGIVAVRDGGDLNGIGLSFRNEVVSNSIKGPRIKASGKALGRKGKYGSFLSPGFTPEEIAGAVRQQADAGADQIKVLVSGVVSFKEYRRVGEIQFTGRQLEQIVYTAGNAGLRVMAHASSDEAVQAAVKAGVDSIEHGYFLSRQSLEAMAGAGITWIPTLAPVANQIGARRRKHYSPEEREIIEKTYRRQQRMLWLAAEAGVPLGIGTDAGATGVLHGKGFLEELLLYREAGLTPEKILLAATAGGAAALGLEEEMGIIRPGRPARLVVVEGDPLKDLRRVVGIKYVILPEKNIKN